MAPEEIKIDERDLRGGLDEIGRKWRAECQQKEKRRSVLSIFRDGHRRPCGCGRSQGQNKERAMEILKTKLYKLQLEEQKEEKDSMRRNKGVEAEWGAFDTVVCFSSVQDGERPPDGSGNGQCGRSSKRRIG